MTPKPMNLVLVVLDSLRKDCVSAYGPTIGMEWFGKEVQTPKLAQFAETAMIFTQAFPEALPTLPFRRAIHTGGGVRQRDPGGSGSPILFLPGLQTGAADSIPPEQVCQVAPRGVARGVTPRVESEVC